MFICNDCLKQRFTNAESLFKSGGSCEICNEKKVCNEIQSSRLTPRVKPLEPVRLDKNGRIRDSKCFIWGDMTKRAVQAKANLEYRQWVTSLIQRNFYDEEELDMDKTTN